MTERYPSFISPSLELDANPSSVPNTCALRDAPVEEAIWCSSNATHQQIPLQHQLYDPINHSPTTHGNPILWTGEPVQPNDPGHRPHHSALGIDGLTSPFPLTTSHNNLNFTINDLSYRPVIPSASSQGVPSFFPSELDSTHHQINGIHSYNQYAQGPFYSESSAQQQPDITHTLGAPPTFGAPCMGDYNTSSYLWPNVHQVFPRTDAHPLTLDGPQSSSSSTPDGSMRVPVLSSGSSPSLSQHHPTPSPVSSFILHTPDQILRHPQSCYQPYTYTTDHTPSRQLPAESLDSHRFAQNAPTIETKQPKAALKSTLQVSGYRKIARAPPNYVKPLGESPSRQEKKRVRRGSKETPRMSPGLSRKSTTQSLPAGTVVFTRPLTPTTVHEGSFDTSSRKVDERIIARIGVKPEEGHSIAPKVQEELARSHASTHAPAHATERTLATAFSRQGRSSKEAKGDGSTSASWRRTSIRSPPAKPQHTSTQPTLRKRQKRHTTDSHSSSNSSKKPTRRSRTNSHEDQKLTSSSPQQISGGRTPSVRKNSGRVATGAATSAPRTERAPPQTRVSPSRIGVPVTKKRGLIPLGSGRPDAIERALGRPGSGSTNKPMSYRKGPGHRPGLSDQLGSQSGEDERPSHAQ